LFSGISTFTNMTECSWTVCKCDQLEDGQLPLLKVHQLHILLLCFVMWNY